MGDVGDVFKGELDRRKVCPTGDVPTSEMFSRIASIMLGGFADDVLGIEEYLSTCAIVVADARFNCLDWLALEYETELRVVIPRKRNDSILQCAAIHMGDIVCLAVVGRHLHDQFLGNVVIHEDPCHPRQLVMRIRDKNTLRRDLGVKGELKSSAIEVVIVEINGWRLKQANHAFFWTVVVVLVLIIIIFFSSSCSLIVIVVVVLVRDL
mmetsp:Transcript_24577/g.75929  ORF Transcript_24577/g.75929 Transcript_24577/m.75929 type:complete len:209 (-) Transcript_24577:138-764(-)